MPLFRRFGRRHSIINSLFLHEPCTKKELCGNESFGFGSMQGWRSSNEDSYKHLVPLDNQRWKNWSYYAIFDGHNGVDTAKNAADLLDQYIIDSLNQADSNIDTDEFHSSIKKIFAELDKNLRCIIKDNSGSVCIASLISPKAIFLINCGDSRAIIISNDERVLVSTKDHKPNVPNEQERICKAGGHITQCRDDVLRVDDQFAMTRALGDFSCDKHIISAVPDIIEYPRDASAAYLILACDGVWDVIDNEQIASFVSQRTSNTTLENIVSQLFDYCLEQQSSDNMTAYIVKLN